MKTKVGRRVRAKGERGEESGKKSKREREREVKKVGIRVREKGGEVG